MSFAKPWSKQACGPIALEVGTRAVRLMQVSLAAEQLEVRSALSAPALPEPADPLERFAAHRDLLRELLRKGGFSGKQVATTLPLQATRIKNFRLPCMPDAELKQAVRFEALERFPTLDEQAQIRYYNAGKVEGAGGAQFELIVLAVPGEVVEAHLEVLRQLGLKVAALELAPGALFRCFERFLQRDEDADQVNAFLDLGACGSRLVLAQGSEITFVKVFDLGLAQFGAAVAKELSLSAAEGQTLLEAVTSDVEPADAEEQRQCEEQRPAVLEAVGPHLEQLSKDIGLCLRYFSVNLRVARPQSITCVGGGARCALLLERLGESLGVGVRAGHPLRHISSGRVFTGADRRQGQPEWATTLGLALNFAAVSGLPQTRRREMVSA